MVDEIRTQFKAVKQHFHWPGSVCGGHTRGVNGLTESLDGTVRICERCLKDGQIDERLAKHAQHLEEEVRKTRSLIGRLQLPSHEDWLAKERRVDAQRIAESEDPY
jgi:hypothetical protein